LQGVYFTLQLLVLGIKRAQVLVDILFFVIASKVVTGSSSKVATTCNIQLKLCSFCDEGGSTGK
jgi:hypothetical protein